MRNFSKTVFFVLLLIVFPASIQAQLTGDAIEDIDGKKYTIASAFTVETVTANSLSYEGKNGKTREFSISSKTPVCNAEGQSISFAEIEIGDIVTVRWQAREDDPPDTVKYEALSIREGGLIYLIGDTLSPTLDDNGCEEK